MTTNQLAYQRNMIDQQLADENERHNKMTELHYERQDQLGKVANDIADARQQEEARHNQRTEELTDTYNRLTYEMQFANEKRKREIEQELANIQAAQVENDKRYKDAMANIAQQEATTKSNAAAEVVRHNEQDEEIRRDINDLTQQRIDLDAKIAYNQSLYWEGSLKAKEVELTNELTKINNSWQATLWNTQLGLYDAQIRLQDQQTKANLAKTQMFKDLATGVGSLVSSVGNTALSIAGLTYGVGGFKAPTFDKSFFGGNNGKKKKAEGQ